jgi:predicted NUDIX family NTP pyrophosphohydrolase
VALTLTRYHIPEAPAGGGPVQISLSEMQAWCVPKPDEAEAEVEAEAEEAKEAEAAEAVGEVTSGPYVEISLLEVEGAGHLGHLGSP